MPPSNVAYQYEFGAALHQDGLNIIAAALRRVRPDLFSKSTSITVKPYDPGPPAIPAHVLTLYVIVDGSPAFNLYPVDNAATLPLDSFFVAINITFTLTDSGLGTITRLGAEIDAAGTIVVNSTGAMALQLATKPDGSEYLDFTNLTGQDLSRGVTLVRGAIDASGDITRAFDADDSALARSFREIVNYLINLYLKQGLRRTVVEFPLPPLNNLVQLGPLGYLPIDRIYVRNKSIYVEMGLQDGSQSSFPLTPPKEVDFRVGASQAGLTRLIHGYLPIAIPDMATGNDHTTFRFYTQGLAVSSIDVGLQPNQAKNIGLHVGVSGKIGLSINFDLGIFGGWQSLDIPVPLDPLTGYFGSAILGINAEQYDPVHRSGSVTISLLPDINFFNDWGLVVITDYRDLLKNAIQAAFDRISQNILGSKFCSIPIIGWIVCGVVKIIDIVGPLIAWVIGAAIDSWLSPFLTFIVTTIGRGILAFIKIQPFKVFGIAQSKLFDNLGTTLASTNVVIQDNGYSGELTLLGWFSDQGLSVPPAPVPPNLPDVPQPPDAPGTAPKTLPTYKPIDFIPALPLAGPKFQDGAVVDFSMVFTAGNVTTTGSMHVTFQLQTGVWYAHISILNSGGQLLTASMAQYAATDASPKHCETASTLPDGSTYRHTIDYPAAGVANATAGLDGKPSLQYPVNLVALVVQEMRESWFLRLAYTPLQAASNSVLGLVDVADPQQWVNYARQIPLTCTITADSVNWPTQNDPKQDVWRVKASDGANQHELLIASKGGLLWANFSNAEHSSSVELKARQNRRKPDL